MKSTMTYFQQIAELKALIESADAVVVGAGAGLSTSAGFIYSGERFEKNFGDFGKKYGFSDMYSGGFYPYDTLEEFWAFWSKYIDVNRYQQPPKDTYEKLFKLVKNSNYFVITTNVDHCFQKAGFDKARLFYTQGDYGLFQCSQPCHKKTYDNESQIKAMVAEQKDFKIPTSLIPRCPKCGRPMTTNLRSDDRFVEDEGWHIACTNYENFLRSNKGKDVLFIELGVGMNTPGIIKYPFWRMTMQNKHAHYACVNLGDAYAPEEIEKRSLCIDEDIDKVIGDVLGV